MISLFSNRIEYFLNCAQMGSFSAASLKIGVTQSTLSAAIKKLEEELKITLFHRSVEGIRLTEQGEILLKKLTLHGDRMNDDIISAIHGSGQSVVKIGCVTHFGARYLLPFLEMHRHALPKPQLLLAFSMHCLQAVETGELDFAFVAWTSQPRGLKYVCIKDDPFAIVGLRSRFRSMERASSMKELEDLPWVHLPKPQYDWTRFMETGRESYVARDNHALREIILGGLAIGDVQLDTFTPKELKALAYAGVKSSWPNTKIYIVHRPEISDSARSCMDYLVGNLGKSF